MSDPATLQKQQSGIASFAVDRFGANTTGSGDLVAVEEPLEIRLGFTSDGLRHTQSISITMRTPPTPVGCFCGVTVIAAKRQEF